MKIKGSKVNVKRGIQMKACRDTFPIFYSMFISKRGIRISYSLFGIDSNLLQGREPFAWRAGGSMEASFAVTRVFVA